MCEQRLALGPPSAGSLDTIPPTRTDREKSGRKRKERGPRERQSVGLQSAMVRRRLAWGLGGLVVWRSARPSLKRGRFGESARTPSVGACCAENVRGRSGAFALHPLPFGSSLWACLLPTLPVTRPPGCACRAASSRPEVPRRSALWNSEAGFAYKPRGRSGREACRSFLAMARSEPWQR